MRDKNEKLIQLISRASIEGGNDQLIMSMADFIHILTSGTKKEWMAKEFFNSICEGRSRNFILNNPQMKYLTESKDS